MYSLHYYPCGQLSSYFSVYSIVVLMDSGIALPRIAQLQVALEEKHHRRLMDFCRRKYYGMVVPAACIKYLLKWIGSCCVQLFGCSMRTINCLHSYVRS